MEFIEILEVKPLLGKNKKDANVLISIMAPTNQNI